MRDFQNLRVWHKANRLAVDVHVTMKSTATRQHAGLRGQILRAATSIPANIAEGCGKLTNAELARYAEIALGSATELENHLIFARNVGVIEPERYSVLEGQLSEVRRMLYAFVRAVRAKVSE